MFFLYPFPSAIKPLAERFAKELTRQFDTLLDRSSAIKGFPIEWRVKSEMSIAAKAQRMPKLEDVRNIPDLIGIRIVLLFRRDVAVVTGLIEDRFVIEQKEDTSERLNEEQFGYQSVHYLVRLSDAWLKTPSLEEYSELRAEIQVRTLAQHIWAAASHHLQYKNKESVPIPVRRSIHRVSALLETADLELQRVLDERGDYIVAVKRKEQLPLNVDILRMMLDSLLPDKNKSPVEDYFAVLVDLSHFGVSNTHDLQELIGKRFSDAIESDSLFSEDYDDHYFTHTGLIRVMIAEEFPEKWQDYQEERALEADSD